MPALEALIDEQYEPIDRALAKQQMDMQSTVPLTKATCSTCLLRQDKLAEQLPALQACLPPGQRYSTSCSILNGAFVVVDQTGGQDGASGEAAEEAGPLICQVKSLQLPAAGEGPLEAQLELDDGSMARLAQVVNFTTTDPQMLHMVAALAEAQEGGWLPPLTLHTLVHTLCRLAALDHLTTLVNQAQGLLEGQDAEEQYNTLQELRCTVGEAVQYVVQGPGFKMRLQLARRAQAAAGGAAGSGTPAAAGDAAEGPPSAAAGSAAGNGAVVLNGAAAGAGHAHRSHHQRGEQQQQQQQLKLGNGHIGSTANGSVSAGGSPPLPHVEHLPDPGTPKDTTQQQQDDISKPPYSPNYGSAVDPMQQPDLPLHDGEPEALELEWDPAAAGPSDLPHLKAAAAKAAAVKASSRNASPAYQQQQAEQQQDSEAQEDWLTALYGAGILPQDDMGELGTPPAPVAAPGDTGAAGATGDVPLHMGDDEAPPPVDWTDEPASQPDGFVVGTVGQPVAAAGVDGAQQQQQGIKRKPPVAGNEHAQPSAKRHQQQAQQQAQPSAGTSSTAAATTSKEAAAAAAKGQAAGKVKVQNGPTSSSRPQAGKQQTSDPARRVEGTAVGSRPPKDAGQQPRAAAGDKGASDRSQPATKGGASSSEAVPKGAPGVTRSGSQPKGPSASKGRSSSRSPAPPRRRRSPSPRRHSSRSPRRGGSPRPPRRSSSGGPGRRRSSPGSRPSGGSRSPQRHRRGPRRSRSRSPVLGPRLEGRSRYGRDSEGHQQQQSAGNRVPRGEEERAGHARPPSGYRPTGGRRVDHYSPSPERRRAAVDSPARTDPGAAAGSTGGMRSPFGAGTMPAMPVDSAVGGAQDYPGAYVTGQQQVGEPGSMLYQQGYHQQQQQPLQGPGGGVGGEPHWVEAGVAEVLAAATGPGAAAAGHSSHYRQPLPAGMPVADMSLAQLHAQASSHTIYYNQLQAQQQQQQGGYGGGMYPGGHEYAGGPGSNWGRGQEGGAGGYSGYQKPAWMKQPEAAGQPQQPLSPQQPNGWGVSSSSGGRPWEAGPLDAPLPSPASQVEPSPRPRVYERLSGLAEPLSPPGQSQGQEGLQRRPSVFAGRLQKLPTAEEDQGFQPQGFEEPGGVEGHVNSRQPWAEGGAGGSGAGREEQAAAAVDPDTYVAQVEELLRGRPGQCISLGDLRKVLPVPQHFMSQHSGVFKFFERYSQFLVFRSRSLLKLVEEGTGGGRVASPRGRPGRGDADQGGSSGGWGQRGQDRQGQFDRHADRPPRMQRGQQDDDRGGRHRPGSPGRGEPPRRPTGVQLHFMVKELSVGIQQRMEERGWQQINLQRDVWPLVPDTIRPLLHPDGPVTLQKFAEDFLLFFDVIMVEEQVRGRWEKVPYLVHRSMMRKPWEPCTYWRPDNWGGCFKGASCKFKHSLSH